MVPFRQQAAERRTRRLDRHRARRQPLLGIAASIAAQPVDLALPVHRWNPAIATLVGSVEIVSFALFVLTGSTLALVALAVSSIGYVVAYLGDRRAVLAFGPDGRGALLASGRSGRPTQVVGPAVLDAPLPTAATGLATAIHVNGATWWLDRSSYHTLRRAGPATDGG